jgi:uncharacterized protein (DUF433 family)
MISFMLWFTQEELKVTVELAPLIVADKDTLGGKPRVKGTRISVVQVIEQLSHGRTIDELLENYPTLTREAILACLAYAGQSLRDETILFSAA